MTPSELDARLLGYVVHAPRRMMALAIGTGLAIAHELQRRSCADVLDMLAVDTAFCDRVTAEVIKVWARADRAGGIEPADFDALISDILFLARAS